MNVLIFIGMLIISVVLLYLLFTLVDKHDEKEWYKKGGIWEK